MNLLLLGCVAFVVSGALILVLWPLCVRCGHVDHPGGRKRHDISTPLSGGIAITIAIVAVGAFLVPSARFAGFTLGVCTLLVLGAMDDRKHVPALLRLAAQTLAVALGMCLLGGVSIERLGNLLGTGQLTLDQWSIAFTIFAAVGVINAVNMIDGMDGLAGGFAVLVIAVLIALTVSNGTSAISLVLLCLSIGSILGFLVFNLRMPWQRRARVFLGDGGSLVLGYMLAWFAIQASQSQAPVIDPIAIVWLFGLPLCDTVYLMGSRVLRGRSPFAADRYHFHHMLQRAGLSTGWALYAWLAVAAAFMAVGVAGSSLHAPEWLMFFGFLLAFAIYCIALSWIWSRRPAQRAVHKTKRSKLSFSR
ncbi:MraY family glycosyltransferase [Salinisphaera hydrothermalis]|uniref:MraY family glycosyltransferase n=1 Tax=Salinisphaera hydrothermalis TaxID=563188 RepID=UPI0033417EE4